MAARRAAGEIARALRDHHERHASQRAEHQPVVAEVTSIGGGTPGFTVTIPDTGFVLESDDLTVGQAVAQYDQDYGIKVGDSLTLAPLENGDYVAVAVHTSKEATKRGPATRSSSGTPSSATGEDGDYSIDPATGAVYGPKAGGVWPSAPLPIGGGAGIRYLYSSDTAASDPTSGKVKFDSATLASITSVRISETDRDGNGLAVWLATFDDSTTTAHRGTLVIVKDGGAPTSILVLDVVSALTDNGTWDSFTVAVLASAGAFADGDPVRIVFSRTGDAGAAGSAGAAGAQAGLHYVYSNDTALTDPTSGKVKFNSTTLGSINSVRISETDGDGNGIAALLATFDDSTTAAHRGVLLVVKEGSPANMLALDITSAITDNGTWDNFTVAVLASSGAFTDGDNLRISFSRTGDTGPSGGAPLAYVEYTADVTISASAEASATTIVTAAAVTVDGSTAILIEGFIPELSVGTSSPLQVYLFDGSTSLGAMALQLSGQNAVKMERKLTPSAGSHTYSLRSARTSGATNGVAVGGVGSSGAFVPGFIRIRNDNNAGPTGATGATGTTGTSFISGTGAPSNALGNNGDTYFDSATGMVYTPKAAGVWPSGVALFTTVVAIGSLLDWAAPARSIPAKYLACYGQSVLRTTYSALFAALCPLVSTFTVTIAAPGVVTTPSAHGLVVGDAVFLTTTGALPTGLAANTTYYVYSVPSSTTFTLGTTRTVTASTGIAIVTTQITTTGSQSGTHSVFHAPHGVADATHFNVPDYRGRVGIGQDDMGGSAAGRLSWTKVPGLAAGEDAHLLLTAELATHSHGPPAGLTSYWMRTAGGGGVVAGGTTFEANNSPTATGNTGSDTPHNNVPPGVIVNKIIFAGV